MKYSWILVVVLLSACGSNPSKPSGHLYQENDSQNIPADSKEMLNVRMGVAYFERGDYDTALEKLKRALSYNSKLAIAHSAIATVYATLNAQLDAERHYKLSVKYGPKDPTILNNYGTYLCQKGEYELALSYYEKTLANPFYKTPETVHENMGVCLVQSNQHSKAEPHFRKALQYNSKLPVSLYNMVVVSSAKGDYMKARAFLQRLQNVAALDERILKIGYEVETEMGNKRAANRYLGMIKQIKRN
ncbi:type IV pilus biogenesis/stability protein PilW [Marinicella rhabdoformis]|uniref:type IV pilus biogenesis/stability protein PilW n=1 Tax=Marinicella rhabdoformis TaxID=2580566 RepID=UPI0012AED21E|nr:type IV pilus biogenesis/stability protein PilW [Marinicella rhabdoformis]